jgi:hypothetical protein
MEVSWNGVTPKSSMLIGFSIKNQAFWGSTIYGNPHMYIYIYVYTHLEPQLHPPSPQVLSQLFC